MGKILQPTDAKFCAWCGGKLKWQNDKMFATCTECDRKSFPNPKPCTAIILKSEDKILLVRRNIEPRKGLLDFPGGFIDITDKSAEEGAAREAKEELSLNLNPERFEYVGSNLDPTYFYQDVGNINLISYYKVDLTPQEADSIQLDSENSGFTWLKLSDLRRDDLDLDCYWEVIEKLKGDCKW
jgi:ADP-ribose pyrophosphatase YjhB (NUDIX family)